MLEDGLEHYNMNLEVVGLTETLVKYLDTSGEPPTAGD